MTLEERLARIIGYGRERGLRALLGTARQQIRNKFSARLTMKKPVDLDCFRTFSKASTRSGAHQPFKEYAKKDFDVKLLAYYLPQFHPIPENDEWWGRGFTEWNNVARAFPQFEGHVQPRLPGELGYYDLRIPEVGRRQVELAKNYGIAGFCYYYYWFSGRRLLERPLDDMLADKDRDFPFCLAWANENWTRTWDGLHGQILIGQRYRREDHIAFARDLLPYFADRRYFKIHARPLFMVYKPMIIPDLKNAVEIWREEWRRLGIRDPYLVAIQTTTRTDPRDIGFDAAAEFPPHLYKRDVTRAPLRLLNPGFSGSIFDYDTLADESLAFPQPPYPFFRGATPGWDNTARRGSTATIYHDAAPSSFERWLFGLVERARLQEAEDRIIFVNAWNEWAEGAYLEPDVHHGYANLEACRRALERR